MPGPANVFISYRRDDSAVAAKLLHDELARHFGAGRVFMDIEDIGYGDDFVAAIEAHLARADVVVVVIGPRWLELLQARRRGDDWVRAEVGRALARRAASGRPRVIAALVDGATIADAQLPEDLRALQSSNLLRIDPRALNESLNALAETVQGERFSDLARERDEELRRRRRAQVAGVAIGFAVFLGGWVALFDTLGLDTRAATATMLLAAALPGASTPPWEGRVVLVAIDRNTEAAVGRRFGPDWRAEHAQLVARAAAAGAATVAFDMTFAAEAPEQADAAFERALAQARERMPVVVGVQQMDEDAPRILPRLAPWVHWGIACAGQRLGLARSLPLAVQRERPGAAPIVLPSLALAAFAAGGRVQPPDPLRQRLTLVRAREAEAVELRFHTFETVTRPQTDCAAIRPGDRVAGQLFDPRALPPLAEPPQRIAYEDVLRGAPPAIEALSGRIVLVGVLIGLDDRVAIGGGGERWGSELIAAQIDALARNAAILPAPWVAQWLGAVALALAGAFVAVRLRRRRRALRVAALASIGVLFVLAAALLYRSEQRLVGVPYGLAALALGAWAAGRLSATGAR